MEKRGGEQKSDRVRRGLELRAHNTEERKRGSAGQLLLLLLKRVQHTTREKESGTRSSPALAPLIDNTHRRGPLRVKREHCCYTPSKSGPTHCTLHPGPGAVALADERGREREHTREGPHVVWNTGGERSGLEWGTGRERAKKSLAADRERKGTSSPESTR